MKEWIAVESEDLDDWRTLVEEAQEFVRTSKKRRARV